jgi:glucose/arabinose dehydrogenase
MKARLVVSCIALLVAALGCQAPSSAAFPTLPPAIATQSPANTGATPAIVSPLPSDQPAAEVPTLPPASSTGISLDAISIGVERVVSGLIEPVDLVNAGDGSGRLFVVEKPGRIKIIKDNAVLPGTFLDLTDRVKSDGYEQGRLGMAFHPDYRSNGVFFVNYTDLNGDTVVSRFNVSGNPDVAEVGTETLVMGIDDPARNHNGGDLVFGPDRMLYIGMGDGGGAGDTYGNGQRRDTLLGKMLRINVDSLPYTIPADNPFLSDPSYYPEIWATGLRNPWRYSFDRLTGDMYIADVGQDKYEELNFQPAGSPGGQNYGWPIMEGFHCFPDANQCNQSGLMPPVAEYTHDFGISVTGGYVYRGSLYPSLQGIYFYGDFGTSRIWGLARDANGTWQTRELLRPGISLSSFGEDEAGELYLLHMGGGEVYRLAGQ